MSFRARLFLFFVIIVVVPMIAVALVLFSLTKDSETGKADAQIAQGLRVAFAEYSDARASTRSVLSRIARDNELGNALARRAIARDSRADARARAPSRRRGGRRLRPGRAAGWRCTGDPTAIAPAVAGRPPRMAGGSAR